MSGCACACEFGVGASVVGVGGFLMRAGFWQGIFSFFFLVSFFWGARRYKRAPKETERERERERDTEREREREGASR